MQVVPQVSPLLLRHHGQQGPHKLLGGATAPAQGNKYGFILHVHVHDQSVIIFKASQPRGRASGSRAYGRHENAGCYN